MIAAAKSVGLGTITLLASSGFSNTITTGSVLVALLVVTLGGIFSFKDKRQNQELRDNAGWKDLFDQEVAKNVLAHERIDELTEAKEEERVRKHQAKDELAASKAQLEIERMKPDLGQVLAKQQEQHAETIKQITTLVTQVAATQERTIELLEKLDGQLDSLAA